MLGNVATDPSYVPAAVGPETTMEPGRTTDKPPLVMGNLPNSLGARPKVSIQITDGSAQGNHMQKQPSMSVPSDPSKESMGRDRSKS